MILLLCLVSPLLFAASVHFEVKDSNNKLVKNVQVSQSLKNITTVDTSDGGYPMEGKPYHVGIITTKFTNAQGLVSFDFEGPGHFRFRHPQYQDFEMDLENGSQKKFVVKLKLELDPAKLADAKPANMWLAEINLGNAKDKKIFQMQCGFCHQQGTSFMRVERSSEEWKLVIQRMIGYGSRLPTDLQEKIPELLTSEYARLNKRPDLISHLNLDKEDFSSYVLREWPIGDMMSQTHDMLVGENNLLYVADNIQDRLYEIDTKSDFVTIYKIPHREGEENGGLIKARLKEFPRHDSTSNAHSLALSKKDGHIFITPSAQRRLVEFDPKTKSFLLHEMDQGFYPHTIRIDEKDRVWFTLALSNQVAMFDRVLKKFSYVDLPHRSFKEKLITNNIHHLFKLMSWGIPLSRWLKIPRDYEGTPLVYGIDLTPDGRVWFARLHTDEIGSIDPETLKVEMYKTPFMGPRRLRSDGEGRLWITAFGDSAISSFDPETKKFKVIDLPVIPKGSETPYSLNVEKETGKVWVTGNQSDSLYVYDIKTGHFEKIPLPRRTTFTRDIEFSKDHKAYTSNSNFPSWHIEDSQPSLIEISRIH
ncbi:MAG: hypothetical protein ACOYL6_19090 [Bacteriovoracaceae bacterium]